MIKKFNNNDIIYPIVLVPNSILNNINEGIQEDQLLKYLEIKKPVKKYIWEPIKPTRIKEVKYAKYNFLNIGCLFQVLFLSPILFFAIRLFVGGNDDYQVYFFITILWIPFLLLIGYKSGSPMLPEPYQAKRNIKLSEEQYMLEMTKYKSAMLVYHSKLKKLEKESEASFNIYKSILDSKKGKATLDIHFHNLKPRNRVIRKNIPAKRGSSEIKFLELAKEKLHDKLFLDMAIEGFEYAPDLTLICPKSGIHIDIEIDEPYTFNEKKPIHFLDCEDTLRNDFFLDQNWCIIRFCEDQIIGQPNDCIKTIDSIYNSILHMKKNYESYVREIKRWTYEESVIMAANNYRKKYK